MGAVSSGKVSIICRRSNGCRRMPRHVEVKRTSAVMSQHHQDKQDSKRGGGDGKEIDRDQFIHVVC